MDIHCPWKVTYTPPHIINALLWNPIELSLSDLWKIKSDLQGDSFCNTMVDIVDLGYGCCRVEEARDILEEVVQLKEEKLGAVHPDVEEDRERLQELLNQVGQTTAAHKRSRKLVELLSTARKAFHTSK